MLKIRIKVYKTIILPFGLYGREKWFLTLREEHKLQVSGTKVKKKKCSEKYLDLRNVK
jgi:hypothetical protein